MTRPASDFMVADLGECTMPSPLRDTRFIDVDERVVYRDDLDELRGYLLAGVEPPSFELAGSTSSAARCSARPVARSRPPRW